MNIRERWQQNRARRAGRKSDQLQLAQGLVPQWYLLAGPAEVPVSAVPDIQSLHKIYPPAGAFWADPFIWQQDGQRVLFFEDYPFDTRRGRISAMYIDEQGQPFSSPFVVLDEPFHLSFPFLFEWQGELFMMPEMAETRRQDVYRCIRFPDRWERVRTLVDGVKMADASLLELDGRWWMFCAAKQAGSRINESLFLYTASSPLDSQWQPVHARPVVKDFATGRPGGKVFSLDGHLYRPSQNCVRRYGHGLNLMRIDSLAPYRETPVWQTDGEAENLGTGLHHMDWHAGTLVMDAQRWLAAGQAPAPGEPQS